MATLDICHKQQLNKLEVLASESNQICEEIEFINKEIQYLESKTKACLDKEEFAKYIEYVDKNIVLKEKLSKIVSEVDEAKYYTDTSDILYQYYNLIQNGNGQTEFNTMNKNSIINYFTSSKQKEDVSEQLKTRRVLLENYMGYVDKNFLKSRNTVSDEKCPHCGSDNLMTLVYDGYIYCKDCFSIDNLLIDHDKPSYKDPPNEVTYFSYKRINHLNEWLNQIQGKETTEIPEEIYDKILFEIKKQRITNMADLSYDRIKSILKQLKVHKYYEHIPHIINRLNGLPMPNFSYELEETLRSMFKQIQTPFLKHSPANRKNFLSYSYVLHKFLQLLEKDEFLAYFPLLKSRDKLSSQDRIWKLICQECGWQFIPSL
jgi:hypothetical protein